MNHRRLSTAFLLAILLSPLLALAQTQAPASGTKDEIKTAGRNGVGIPKCIDCPSAPFTDKARKDKLQGTVDLAIVVGPDGLVTDAKVTKGLPDGLNDSALDTVKKWRFKPAVDKDGTPIPVKVQVQVSFHLY